MELFYTFQIGEAHIGCFYLKLTATRLLSMTRFRQTESTFYTNRFDLRFDQDHIRAIRHGEADWVDLSNLPDHHYPSPAHPLLLTRVSSKQWLYLHSGSGHEWGRVRRNQAG